MNRMEKNFRPQGEAKLKYLSGEFRILSHGSYVVCAVTGEQIPLEELRYWNPDLQEAYISPDVALKRHKEIVEAEK